MSGHSKWAKIKRKKAANDTSRSRMFSRLVKEITVAARMGGGDPDGNARLRSAIDVAKRDNLPAANVDKAIKRGTGELPGVIYEEITYEGFGPGSSAILVQAATDNRNRTVAEIRKIFEKAGGHLGEQNSVAWKFKSVGYFLIDASAVEEDELLMAVLEAGAEDVSAEGDVYEVLSPPSEFHAVQLALRDAGIETHAEELAMLPHNPLELDDRSAERCLRLMETLEEHDDIQSVWANVDIKQELVERVAAG